MALSEERRKKLEEEQKKAAQKNLQAAAQADAAYFDQIEAERRKNAQIDYGKALQRARVEQANRNNQAIQYAREAAREEFNTNLPEYREQERERWKATTQAWREAENARKYYDTRSAETNAREKQRRANAMKDYTALQAQRDNYEYKKNVERAPYQYARQVGYDRDEIRSLDQKYTSLNQRAAALEYEAQKALKNDIPKMQNVMDTEKKYGTQDSARAIAGMIETGGAFDPKKNYSGAGKKSQAQLIAKTVYLSAIGGVPDPTGRLSFNTDYMTDSEKAVILKMAYAGDLDQLYQYANDLIPVLDAREYDAKQQQISQMSRPMQVAYGMTGTIASPLAYAQMGIDTLRGGYTDLNSGAVAATRLAQEARTKSLENASPVGQFMGNVAYSMADNLVSMSLGQTGALIWLGLSAAGNEGVNALENGATQKQAFAKATASGLIETATEKMGIDNLFDIAKKAGSRGIKSMLLDIAKQAGSEGTEEIISEFANAFADAAIMGQESDFNKAVRAYEAENMSHDEALRKATFEFFVKNPAMAGLAGAVSGALFGVGGVTVQQRNQIRADRTAGQQITNRENVGGSFEDIVLDEGMKSTDKRIRDMSYNLDAIRNENQSNKTREYTEGFKWSAKQQRQIGEIYDSLDADAKARIGVETDRRTDAAVAEQNRQKAEQDKAIAAREAELNAEQQQTAADDADAELDAEEAELAAQYARMQQESGETVDMDNPQTVQNTAAEEQQTQRKTEAEEFDRLAAAAEEATRTGDTSVLDRAAQERPAQNTAAQTAQPTQETQRSTAQPVTPEQAGQQTANNARKAGLSAEDTLAMSNVARQIGVGLDFEDIRDSRIDGYYDRVTGRVVLNKNLSSADMAWTTFAHEITHRAESAQSYGQLVNVAKAYVTREADPENADRTWRGFVNGTWQEYMSAGIKVDRQGAEFESVARTIEAILGSRESIEAVARYSREDAQALLASINDVLDNTTENGTAVTPESARLVQAQKTLAAALSEVREQQGNGTATQNKTQSSNIPPEGVPDAKSEDGEVLTREMPGGTIAKQYSLSSWTEEERRIVREELIKKGFDADSVDKWIKDVNSIASLIAADKARLDYQADPNQVMLKLNAEYVVTLDASTLCAKRLLYQGTFNLVQKNLPNTPLMPEDLIALVNMMREEGYETPCGICYVESRRRQLGKFAQEWLNSYSGEYKPTLAEVTTSDGLANLRKTHFQTYNDFIKAMNKKGTMNPKVVQLRTDYRGDIRKMTKGNIQKVKDIGGLRVQSFSDFEIPHLIDMMQAVMDMASRELTSQAYTKVPAFPAVFGNTGIKINLSLIGKGTGLDANGNLIFDDIEGMPFDEAMRLRDMYSENVGTILVGINDAHIIAAMADDRIDFIIPFHKSGWSAKELEGMPVLNSYDDYTNSQNEKKITGRNANGAYTTESLEASKRVNFQPVGKNGYWDFNKSGEENAREYLRMCAEDGRIPKFSQFLTDNGDGTFSLPDGSDARSKAIRKGYWKTLIDFKMYDNSGKGAPQRAVKPNFNMKEARRVIASYSLDRTMPSGKVVSRESNNDLPVARDIADEFVTQYKKEHGMATDTPAAKSKQYKTAIDQDLIDAANAGKVQLSLNTEVEDALDDMTPEELDEALGYQLRKLGIAFQNASTTAEIRAVNEAPDKKTIVKNAVRDIVNEFDPTIYNGKLYVKPETLDFWLSSGGFASSNPKYAQAYITTMNPADFLRMTTATEDNQRRILNEATTLDENKLSENAMRQPIQLEIDEASGKIIGHEGRHRAVALARAGVTEMPVLLFDSSTKYDKTEMPEMTLRGQNPQFDDTIENGNTLTFYDVIPLSSGNTDIIRERFTASAADKASAKANNQRVLQSRVSGFDLEADIRKAVERYGKMRSGEQLYYVDENGKKVYVTSKVDLPKGTSAETRTRGFNRTVAESNNIKADTRDLAVANQYRPTSNEENVRKAEEMRGTDSFEQALGTWNTLVRSGRLSYKNLSVDIAFGERLLLEAQKEGNADAVRSIITDLAEIGTTFGQATQAFSLLKRMSPEGQLVQYKREGDRYYEKLNRHGKYTNKKAKRQVDYSDNLQKAEDALGRLEDAKNKLSEIKKDKNHTAAQIKKAEADIASINNEIKRALADLAKAKQDWRHTRGVLIRTQLNRRELNREIKATQDRIENALAEIPKLQTEIDRLQGELWALENKETKKKAERDALREKRKELKTKRDNMMARIATLSRQIPQLQADIDSLFSQMAIGEDNEADMRSYRDVLKKSRSIMQEYLRYVKRKGSVIIPQDLQDEYVNAKTDDERAVVLKKIEQSIADQLPGTWAEKIRAVRYISMLFNPTTHERNILGNATQFGFVKTRDVLATLGEMAFLRNGEERTHAFMGGRKSADAKYWEAADADYKEMMAIVQGNRTDIGAHLEEMRRIFKSAFMEKIRTTSSNTLEAEDRFWLSRHYKSAFAQYLKSNNLDPSNLTEEQLDRARTIAVQQAQKATYRDYSAFADQLNRLEKSSAAAEFFMGGLMPFKKTPLNVLKRGVEYSPLGAFKTAADFIKLKRGDATVTAADVINDAAQTLTGTLATGLGILLGALGWAHASPGEDDKDRKKNFDKATGMQNYSIEIPGYDENGKWSWKAATYTVDWLSPFSMPLFIGVRIAELVKGQDGGLHSFQDFVDAASSIAEPVFQLSMLDGLTSALQSYQSSGAGVARSLLWSVAESYALQFFPTLGSKMARIIDPTQRSTKAFKYSTWFGQDLERLYRRVFAKIPGLSYTLKPVIDKNGDFKKNVGSNMLERIAYNLASPGYFSYKTKNEEDAETSRLYDALIGTDPDLANAILPKEISTYWELNGEKYYLNAETYKRFAETQGREESAGRKALYASDAYKAATDAEKASMIKRVLDDAQEKAKIGFFEDIGMAEEYYRSKLNDSVYEKDGTPKNTTAVTELYESDALDLAAVYRGEKALSGLSQKDDKTNALKAQNLSEDEYNFLYMTHVMTSGSQRDDVETMTQQIGMSLTQAIQIAENSYGYNDKGEYTKTMKQAAEAILAANLTDDKKGLTYLQWAISDDDRPAEERKMQVFYDNKLTASDYIKSKATLSGLDDSKIRTKTDALLASDLSQETKETAFLTMVSESKDYEAAIPAFKRKGLTVDDFLRSASVITGTESRSIGARTRALLDSNLSDTVKETAFLSIVSDAQGYVDAMQQFKKAGMGTNDFLRCVEAFSGDGMNNAKKTEALMRLNVKSPLTVVTSMITSGNKVEGLWECKDAGISEKDIVKAFAQYAKIDTQDIKAKEKAEEFAYWVDTNMQLSDAHRDLLVDTMVYYTSVPAKATNYLKYSDMPNVSSIEARYISEDLAALVPREGKDSVNDWQRVIAIANDKRLTSAASEQAIYGILDNKDDGKESSALTKYKDVVSKGVSPVVYATFRETVASYTSDYDANGKAIEGKSKKDKILAVINSYTDLSRTQKDALYYSCDYSGKTINEAPWH